MPARGRPYLEVGVEGDDHGAVRLVPLKPTYVQAGRQTRQSHTVVYTCATHTPMHLGSLTVLVSCGSSTVMETAGGLSTSAHETYDTV